MATDKVMLLAVSLDMRNPPEGRKAQLSQLLDVAASRITKLGIQLNDQDPADVQLQVDYAAWMYKRRNQTATDIPRWLEFDIHNRLVNEKGRVNKNGA